MRPSNSRRRDCGGGIHLIFLPPSRRAGIETKIEWEREYPSHQRIKYVKDHQAYRSRPFLFARHVCRSRRTGRPSQHQRRRFISPVRRLQRSSLAYSYRVRRGTEHSQCYERRPAWVAGIARRQLQLSRSHGVQGLQAAQGRQGRHWRSSLQALRLRCGDLGDSGGTGR